MCQKGFPLYRLFSSDTGKKQQEAQIVRLLIYLID